MSKVIVERPRYHGHYSERPGRAIDPDLQRSNEGIKFQHRSGGKELNENLAPLRRFLESRVGHLWNDVYSEICEHLRADNTVQQHVRDHIDDFVERKLFTNDAGETCVQSRYNGLIPLSKSWAWLYVDPETGILKKNNEGRRYSRNQQRREDSEKYRTEKLARERTLPDGTEFRKIDGIWYEIVMKPVPAPVMKSYTNTDGTIVSYETGGDAYDFLTGTTIHYRKKTGKFSTPAVYASSKRQLSNAELRKHDLKNN